MLSSVHLHRPLLLHRNPVVTVWTVSLHCQATTFEYIIIQHALIQKSIFPQRKLSDAPRTRLLILCYLEIKLNHCVALSTCQIVDNCDYKMCSKVHNVSFPWDTVLSTS